MNANSVRRLFIAVIIAAIVVVTIFALTSCKSTPHYASCAEARKAGAAPLRSDEPGYQRYLDRDGNGVACE